MSAFTEDGADIESTLKMDYIELAALGMVHLPVSGERVSAHMLAGPALALEAFCGWPRSVCPTRWACRWASSTPSDFWTSTIACAQLSAGRRRSRRPIGFRQLTCLTLSSVGLCIHFKPSDKIPATEESPI